LPYFFFKANSELANQMRVHGTRHGFDATAL
jgi:hypothetical protein